jgi:hypothetical protein
MGVTVEGRSICPGSNVNRNGAPGINDVLNVDPAIVILVGMLEQRHLVRFLFREGIVLT